MENSPAAPVVTASASGEKDDTEVEEQLSSPMPDSTVPPTPFTTPAPSIERQHSDTDTQEKAEPIVEEEEEELNVADEVNGDAASPVVVSSQKASPAAQPEPAPEPTSATEEQDDDDIDLADLEAEITAAASGDIAAGSTDDAGKDILEDDGEEDFDDEDW